MSSTALAARLRFEEPSLERLAAFEAWRDEWRDDPYPAYRGIFARAWVDAAAYIALCKRARRHGLAPKLPFEMQTLWCFAGDDLVGELQLTFAGNPNGHIGYKVRPSARGRGIATALLRHGLLRLHRRHIETALLTCNDSNAASAAVIERCGGLRLADGCNSDGSVLRRYSLSTSPHELSRLIRRRDLADTALDKGEQPLKATLTSEGHT